VNNFPDNPDCLLCGCKAVLFVKTSKSYFKCSNCLSIFLSQKDFVSADEERARYEEHNNDVSDAGYRNFVKPLTEMITGNFTQNEKGLDFGCGPGPVISVVLEEKGFDVAKYDPFFFNNPELLHGKYDFVACSEAVEHFFEPYKEFGLLRTLLKQGGSLYIMTDFFGDRSEEDFKKWYYKDDQTHVFFYHDKSFEWIKTIFGFSSMMRVGRVVIFQG